MYRSTTLSGLTMPPTGRVGRFWPWPVSADPGRRRLSGTLAMPRPNPAEQRLFDSLVQRRGTDEITVALCRSMAVLLAADVVDPKAAQSAASLAALLPPPK